MTTTIPATDCIVSRHGTQLRRRERTYQPEEVQP